MRKVLIKQTHARVYSEYGFVVLSNNKFRHVFLRIT